MEIWKPKPNNRVILRVKLDYSRVSNPLGGREGGGGGGGGGGSRGVGIFSIYY